MPVLNFVKPRDKRNKFLTEGFFLIDAYIYLLYYTITFTIVALLQVLYQKSPFKNKSTRAFFSPSQATRVKLLKTVLKSYNYCTCCLSLRATYVNRITNLYTLWVDRQQWGISLYKQLLLRMYFVVFSLPFPNNVEFLAFLFNTICCFVHVCNCCNWFLIAAIGFSPLELNK